MEDLTPHPLNKNFTWKDIEGPFRRLSQEQADSYNRDGFFVLEDALDEKTCTEWIEAIDPVEAEAEKILREQMGGRAFIARAGEITFTNHLAMKSEKIRQWISGPIFQDLCMDIIGPDVRVYWDMAVYKKPGTEKPFPWHQDNGYTFVEPQQYLTCWIALTDTDETNGCPWVIPGRHREGTFLHKLTDIGFRCIEGNPEEAMPVPTKAGSVVVFSSLTPHATGPNESNGIRKTYIAEFAPDGAVTVGLDKEKKKIVRTPCNFPRHIQVVKDGKPA